MKIFKAKLCKALSLLSCSSINEPGIAIVAHRNDLSGRLSERECDVLKLVVEGKDYGVIPDKLF